MSWQRSVSLAFPLMLGVLLALALSACGKYGPPVRPPALEPAAQPSTAEVHSDDDREESKK